jgi:hypothetical protein
MRGKRKKLANVDTQKVGASLCRILRGPAMADKGRCTLHRADG